MMCIGGAESPRTLPNIGGPLLSTVFVGRRINPCCMELINPLLSPGPDEVADVETGGANVGAGGAAGAEAGGGTGAAGVCAGADGGRGGAIGAGGGDEAAALSLSAPPGPADCGLAVGNMLPNNCLAISSLLSLPANSSSLLSSSSFSLTSSQSSSTAEEGAVL